jgi:hypothetical protein
MNVNKEFQRSEEFNFTIYGQVYHFINLLLLNKGKVPKFA